ncbi:GFA family protein [Phenylobacterium sp.]|uniref:GFA family protein n=1 Tax=Phenylobacterium sp. TaxID=1871053 RepID=UPI0025DB3548|nr:GFA family protein [Phenylobacterium sp.]
MSTPAEPFAATGRCLCGDVSWGVAGRLPRVGFCHCSLCRKASGTGSNAVLSVRPEHFVWLSGEDKVRGYALASGWSTSFCGRCGCPAPLLGGEGRWFVPAGSLDGQPDLKVSGHIFVADKPAWAVIGDDSPQFPAWPPQG